MSSSLLKKLSLMNSAAPRPETKTETGLFEYHYEERIDAELNRLNIAGLRRMGYTAPRFELSKCLFLDTETTGLSSGAGTVVFLVGLGRVRGDVFTVDQYMIRDYPSECLLLEKIADMLDECDTVVTYNGKTFDMPLIANRFTMMRMRARYREREQLDLMYPARRLWKLRLDSVKLSSVEENILGLSRVDDVPGSEVPQRFFDYLKDGDSSRLAGVVDHNRQDIVSLAKLLPVLNRAYTKPEDMENRLDLFSAGKAIEKMGEPGVSRVLYEKAARPVAVTRASMLREGGICGEANTRLYRLLRREKRYEECRTTLEIMIRRKQKGIYPYVELAKLLEHKLRDPVSALSYTEKALRMCTEEEAEELQKRKLRLIKKQKG